MKFNSSSITLNRGVQIKIDVSLPAKLESYTIPSDVWKESVEEFNKELDERSTVSEIIKGIEVDVLRINRTMNTIVLWMTAKESDVDKVSAIKFILKGKVVFEDEQTNRVEKIIIQDLLYGEGKSIFKKKKKELTVIA